VVSGPSGCKLIFQNLRFFTPHTRIRYTRGTRRGEGGGEREEEGGEEGERRGRDREGQGGVYGEGGEGATLGPH
jgi:hypothetical protein